MSLPNGGRDKALLEHSAGPLVVQSPDPAMWQHHNENLAQSSEQ